MDIKTFIHQVAGDWFTQKTTYDLEGLLTDSRKANLSLVFLEPGDAAIAPLCEQCQVDTARVWGALQTQWDTSVDFYKSKETGHALLVLLDGEGPAQGKFIRTGSTSVGDYTLADDEVLTLTQAQADVSLCDRIWFAINDDGVTNKNLRFHTGVVEKAGKISHTTFYSEVRRMPPKETKDKAD